ncbi:hypothetical protein PLANPX_5982 [Lacipirellula parvula]|uniref:Uncharacterized protein n=1 Tax=Lacipirellula parvula TaxID=2650471 RepID=A0A5K7XHL3_9BACT|nr:hypothetical protein PLANPX_5982 [Lacipirellula parvula]
MDCRLGWASTGHRRFRAGRPEAVFVGGVSDADFTRHAERNR